jgi:hypothetical protein
MARIKPFLCAVGRHRWETHADAEGSMTSCSRCGKLHHRGTGMEPPSDRDDRVAAESLVDTSTKFLP